MSVPHKKKRARWRVGGFPNEPCDKLEATFTRLKKEKNTHIKPSRGQKERGGAGVGQMYLEKFIQSYCTLKSLVP